MSNQNITRLFIANRGEIARRIACSAKIAGIETVCISANPPPHYLAECIDQFVFVENESTDLFLDADFMIKKALEAKCNAIHPGFGFLSENSIFAQKVIDQNLIWIGPSPEVIRQMGDKSQARSIAEKIGIPCLHGLSEFNPNSHDAQTALKHYLKKAEYPLLIKAAFGGGGKGMRLVHNESEVADGVQRAASEALNAFSNDTLIIEQYLEKARHIEVQVLADKYGNIKILGDRDCSSQRRHQKIIEEAPAPGLSAELREQLYDAAYTLSKEVSYCSCGTIEFLVSKDRTSGKEKFYFLEMNTRLQVEHTVTEEIFGIDLVSWQFKIANSEQLSKECLHLQSSGHSIEARIYAEDPEQKFIPSPSNVYGFFPHQTQNIRWEIGLDSQDVISNHFDPMIAKVVSKGDTREQARILLLKTLENTFIGTQKNNREFLCSLLSQKSFVDENINTNYIKDSLSTILKSITDEKDKVWSLIKDKIPYLKEYFSHTTMSDQRLGIREITSQIYSQKTQILNNKKNEFFKKNPFTQISNHFLAHPYKQELNLNIKKLQYIDSKNQNLLFTVVKFKNNDGPQFFVLHKGYLFFIETKEQKWSNHNNDIQSKNYIEAPVPGKIVKITITENEKIEAKKDCFILESMKMEFPVKVDKESIIVKILVKEGQQVISGQKLATLSTEP